MPDSPESGYSSEPKNVINKIVPAPLRRAQFRQLWFGMASSYAGDRFQQLAQTWLVAIITSSALAVGWIGVLGSIPLVFMPLGGVIADQVDRRRLLINWQIVGGIATVIIAVLVWLDQIATWHIYIWSAINGLTALFSRPAYKVFLTEVVPADEVRPAVSINSITETSAMIVVNGVGSLLLNFLGLVLAFILNALTYFIAVGCLWGLKDYQQNISLTLRTINMKRLISDLIAGLRYLVHKPSIFHPLLLTFATILVGGPIIGLLAAIVEESGGTIIDLGILSAAGSLGALLGAGFAGFRSAGKRPVRTYALLGLIGAVAIAAFAIIPIGLWSMIPFAILGVATFSQAVWNTSRVAELAESAYQARLQSITSMAFNLGFALSMLWAGAAIDQFGLMTLVFGAIPLALISVVIIIYFKFFDTAKMEDKS
jgi:MFS family permease